MNSITIGPLFVPASPPPAPDPEVVPLGVSIEMAGADGSYQAPLYRKASRWNPHLCKLTDILVNEADLPCEFSYRPIFAAQTQNGMFIPLESLLVGLYESFQMPRSIFAVFTDLRDMVEFSEGMLPPRRPLTPAAAKLGFEVNHVESYSQRLLVDIDWFPPQDRGGPERRLIVDTAAVDFRPLPNGTLGRGKWYQPKEGFARVLFCAELRKVVPGDPIDLFTDEGKAELLGLFQWTPLSRMTSKQAREARLQFIRQHSDLVGDGRKLAEAMQKAGLYSECTTPWQIAKFLPALLAELEAPGEGNASKQPYAKRNWESPRSTFGLAIPPDETTKDE